MCVCVTYYSVLFLFMTLAHPIVADLHYCAVLCIPIRRLCMHNYHGVMFGWAVITGQQIASNSPSGHREPTPRYASLITHPEKWDGPVSGHHWGTNKCSLTMLRPGVSERRKMWMESPHRPFNFVTFTQILPLIDSFLCSILVGGRYWSTTNYVKNSPQGNCRLSLH